MRSTLPIDDNIMVAAKHLAARQKLSMGEVISTLARQGLQRAAPGPGGERTGVSLLPVSTVPVIHRPAIN